MTTLQGNHLILRQLYGIDIRGQTRNQHILHIDGDSCIKRNFVKSDKRLKHLVYHNASFKIQIWTKLAHLELSITIWHGFI